jgi:integrase
MVKLTEHRVLGFHGGNAKSLCVLWDSDCRGLGVRYYPSGRKSYILRYQDPQSGKLRIRTIGAVVDWTLKDVRRECFRLGVKIKAKSKLRAEMEGSCLFRDCSKEWLDKYARQHRSSWANDRGKLKNYILPAIGSSSLGSIDARCLSHLHHDLSQAHPVAANRCIELIRTIYNKAIEWGLFSGRNPAMAVKKNRERARTRYFTESEIADILAATEPESQTMQALIKLLFLTGCRKSEILNARWPDVDWQAQVLIVKQTKSGHPYYIYLSQPAIEILQALPRVSDYIIAGKKGRFKGDRKVWLRICARAGIEGACIHDIRRTVASILAQGGQSLYIVGQVLNHSSQATTARYAQLNKGTVKIPLDLLGEKIAGK